MFWFGDQIAITRCLTEFSRTGSSRCPDNIVLAGHFDLFYDVPGLKGVAGEDGLGLAVPCLALLTGAVVHAGPASRTAAVSALQLTGEQMLVNVWPAPSASGFLMVATDKSASTYTA